MSEPRVLLCGPALDADESACRLEMLRALTIENATKFLVTTGKFDTQKEARAFNVDAHYPAETALLQTLSRWAQVADRPDERFRDGYDLFCLQRIVEANDGFDIAVLLRDGTRFEERWSSLMQDLGDRPFLTFETNLAINLRHDRAKALLDRTVEIYLTARSYAIAAYALDLVLEITVEALGVEDALTGSLGLSDRQTGNSRPDLAETARPVFG